MKGFYGLRLRLAATFFAVTLVLLSVTAVYLLRWTESYYTGSVSEDLKRESAAVGGLVRSLPAQELPEFVTRLGSDLGHRVTVISSDGSVLADSRQDYRRMPNHSDRPEFRQAIATGYGTSIRYSSTVKTRMLYVATPYGRAESPAGVVRVSEPLSGLDRVLRTIQRTFLLACLVAVLAAALLSLRIAASVTEPIEEIAAAAGKLGNGDMTARVRAQPKSSGELRSLAAGFNAMARQLESKISEVEHQNARMQAIFDHTNNGLILEGKDGRVEMINSTACRMLAIDCDRAVGQTLIESTLSHDLAGLVERVRRTGEPGALDLEIPGRDGRSLRAYVAPVAGPDGSGVLVVLHDLTSARKLDEIRRDFLANASHELRTPLATIKAMAETILLRHEADPGVVPGFADSIVHEADRMTQLAEDLLSLTSIESRVRGALREQVKVGELVEEVFEHLRRAATVKAIGLDSQVSGDQVIECDRNALFQVLTNLVDNAIKYTPDGGTVKVSAESSSTGFGISVSDNGIGIPAADQPRIFERFYRVDKDRSRQSGGTGLGLAIVKHLCDEMGGKVTVSSHPGKGATFTVHLPSQPAEDET